MSFHGNEPLDCDAQLMFMQPQGGAKSFILEYVNGLVLYMSSDSQCEDVIRLVGSWSRVLGKCESLNEEDGMTIKGLSVDL